MRVKRLAFDEFEGKLGPDCQLRIHDESHVSFTKKPGTLTITTQAGGFARLDSGFKNLFRVENEIVNLEDLAAFGDGATVDAEVLSARGLIRGGGGPVKLLAEGDAPKNLTVKLTRVSAAAKAKVEAAGGSVELV